jgi:hypothetical protein
MSTLRATARRRTVADTLPKTSPHAMTKLLRRIKRYRRNSDRSTGGLRAHAIPA